MAGTLPCTASRPGDSSLGDRARHGVDVVEHRVTGQTVGFSLYFQIPAITEDVFSRVAIDVEEVRPAFRSRQALKFPTQIVEPGEQSLQMASDSPQGGRALIVQFPLNL